MADKKVTFLINANVNNFAKNLTKAQRQFRDFGNSMKSMGRSMTMSLTAPIGIAGIAVVKLAADFQTSMKKIETLVGLTSNRVNAMKGNVLSLSNTTGVASKELSEALFVVTSAGQRGAEAMQILERSAKATAIGMGETKEIARAITAVMNAYGKENMSAAKTADQLTAIIREGNMEAADLAGVIGRVIGLASIMGVSFAEAGSSVATFTRLGVSADEAVTGLRGLMNAIASPAKQSTDALKKLGLSFKDIREQVRGKGLARTLYDLTSRFKDNEEAISNLSVIIPNVRALAAALGTAAAQGKSYLEITENIVNSNGMLSDGFGKLAGDTGFEFNRTLQSLKNSGIELGTILLPMVTKLLGKVRSGIQWFSGLSDETKKLVLILTGMLAASGPIMIGLGAMAVLISSISLPIVGVIAGIAVLGAAILYLWDNWKAISDRISDWSWWKNMLIDMAQFFLKWNHANMMIKGWNWVVGIIPDMWDGVIKYVSDVNWWKTMLVKMGRLFLNTNPFYLLFKAIEFLVGFDYSGIFDGITKGLDEVEKSINKNIYTPLQIVNPFELISDGLNNLRGETKIYTTELKGFGDTAVSVWNKTKNALLGLSNAMGGGIPAGGGGAPAGDGGKPGILPGQDARSMLRGLKIPDPGASVLPGLNKTITAIDGTKKSIVDMGAAIQNVLNTSIADFATTLGNVFTGDAGASGFFNNLLLIVVNFAEQFGKALIAAGVASEAFQTLLGDPVAAVIAGIALVATATAVKNILTKGPAGMEAGGVVPAGFPNDSYPAMLTSGETVLPSPKSLPNMSYGGGKLSVEFSMRKLVIELDRERENMMRSGYRGYGG